MMVYNAVSHPCVSPAIKMIIALMANEYFPNEPLNFIERYWNTISVPPVEAPIFKIIPIPTPINTPPKTAFNKISSENFGSAIATAIVTPHMVCVAVAAVMTILGFFGKKRWGFLVAGILLVVAAVVFLTYAMMVAVQAILAFIAYARMGVIVKKVTGDTEHLNSEFVEVANIIIDLWKIEQNHEENSNYRFIRNNCPESDTLPREGLGTKTVYTGMTWSGFRPSDDACTYSYLVPSNMFAVVVLNYVDEMIKNFK